MIQQFGRLILSGKKGFYEIQLLSDKPLLSKTIAIFETSSELDSFHNFGFSCTVNSFTCKKTRLSLISTVYEKRNSPYKLSRIIYKGVYRFIVIFL